MVKGSIANGLHDLLKLSARHDQQPFLTRVIRMVPLNGLLHAREALGQPAVPATRLWQARVGLALGQACPRQPAKAGSPAVRGAA